MVYSILHISDLHRSPDDPIDNDELVSALVGDRDRYVAESPNIRSPDAIIVSGDLVQGAPHTASDPHVVLREQYAVAIDFVGRLAEAFLDGDRRRVILIPGNHDVAWHVARAAMRATDTTARLEPRAFAPTTELRWSWDERRVYRIVDQKQYEERFRYFREAALAFYTDVDLAYPLNPDEYFQLFELHDGRIAVAAFNSCSGNDCFMFQGHIPKGAIARAHLALREKAASYELQMAVWHHSIEGAPEMSDYLDVATIYDMIGGGFRVGVHGHQHRSQMNSRIIHIPQQEPMAVISAGSLCAGHRELPKGINRQYNLIELSEDLSSARIHVREITAGSVFGQCRRTEFGGESFVDLSWNKPRTDGGMNERARQNATVLLAERAMSEDQFELAVDTLQSLGLPLQGLARSLLLRALEEGQMWSRAIAILTTPAAVDELILRTRAHVALGQYEVAEEELHSHAGTVGLTGPTLHEIEQWIKAQRQLHND